MKKQMLMPGALLCVLLLCIGGYLGLRSRNQKTADRESAGGETFELLSAAGGDITALSYQAAGETVKLIGDGDNWRISGHEEIPVDAAAVDTMLGYLDGLSAQEKLTEPQEDAVYGLSEPSNVITVQTKEGQQTLLVGNYNELNDCYYIKKEGDSAVYMIYAYLAESFDKTPEQLRLAEEETEGAFK